MKLSLLVSVLTVAATVLICSCAGQAADSPDLENAGVVRVEGTDGAPVTSVHVRQEGEILVIWGMFFTAPLPGHVDVRILTPDRKPIADTQVVPTVVIRTITKKLRWRFDARLRVTPPEDAIVQIGYGFGYHEAVQTKASDETEK